jgi:2-polyprenyl-3-methyl-5-hydroxy-6-metoxy-1,4-benzoquinol methylase
MLEINVEQKKYYEVATGGETAQVNSKSTNLWRKIRRRAFSVFSSTDRNESINSLHREWIGDASGLKILDLGVGGGNPLSLELAAAAREYVAIDLSQSRIDELREKLANARITGAKLYVADFLSDEFPEEKFDLIYAMAVFHHFRHFDAFLDVVERRLAPHGRIVTFDPCQVSRPARLVRAAFRPLQTDAAWEYPFTERSMKALETRFNVLTCQGVLGASKWASGVGIVSPSLGAAKAQQWHSNDLRTKRSLASLRSCLQVSYHLQKMS